MKLVTRFNLLFLALFLLAAPAALWLAKGFLEQAAKERISAEAELIAETASATRRYTEQQVKPLLARLQRHESSFLAQSVPTYSVIQVFDYLHQANPQYTYKDAMANPTNPADRATGWEADVINEFKSNPNLRELSHERVSSVGRSYFFARPIIISNTEKACLDCHSTPTRAPAAMLREYGPDNGFGWKPNQILGVQIISVPASVPIEIAHTALRTLSLYLVAAAIAVLVILDSLLIVAVIRPVAKLSRMADDLSQGKEGEDLPVRGKDEISILATSFNRMRRSLTRVMKMLERPDEL